MRIIAAVLVQTGHHALGLVVRDAFVTNSRHPEWLPTATNYFAVNGCRHRVILMFCFQLLADRATHAV